MRMWSVSSELQNGASGDCLNMPSMELRLSPVTPLRTVTFLGSIISGISFIYIVVTLIQTLLFGIDVPGYVTTLSAVLFLGGIIELSVGILGEYVAHIYIEIKHRPILS